MFNRRVVALLIWLGLEFAIVGGIGFLGYRWYQNTRLKARAEQTIQLQQRMVIASQSAQFRYYYEPKPGETVTQSPSWLGYSVAQTINHDTLNEPKDYSIEKSPEGFRILALGDSFTYGEYVNTAENWTEVLETALSQEKFCQKSPVEVINLGVSGFDVPYTVHRYETVGAKYLPDLIVWFESGTGFKRLNELMFPRIDTCVAQIVPSGKPTTPDEVKQEDECWRTIETQMYQEKNSNGAEKQIQESYQKFFNSVTQTPVLIFSYQDPPEADLAEMSLALSNHPNAQFLPLVPFLTPETRLADGHPNKAGQKIIAETVLTALKQQQAQLCQTREPALQ